MPTENRSSNTEMVSVPRYLAEEINAALINHGHVVLPRGLQEAMNAQAEQHQETPVGEVVAFGKGLHEIAWAAGRMPKLGAKLYTHPAPADPSEPVAVFSIDATGYRARILESATSNLPADGALLYASADPREIERLRAENEELRSQLGAEISKSTGLRTLADGANKWRQRAIDSLLDARDLTDTNNELHAKLAERDALLRDFCAHSALICGDLLRLAREDDFATTDPIRTRAYSAMDHARKVKKTLSASAEPSAQAPLCSTCKGYGKYQDGDSGTDEDGRCPNIVDCDCDDSERMPQYRANAPVERDERAEVKPDAWRVSINGNWEYFRSYEQALKELREWQSDYLPEELEEAKADGLCEPEPVYARAAMERNS
ncbi:hypothetical protein LU645_29700 [Pseudomonas asiatica]|uniref:hypothetical protein n=1 Tax=Pseudomonas asiatica TaxID=2219225 RepID=UPI001E57287F|nr:hypothetical protein [Pseudomonas asiatica]MCE1033093.1 hypothetical protein [Pseudomonas asiatica]